jgi:hypothetical protein
MRFDAKDKNNPRNMFAVLTLDGEVVGCVQRADTEEGWIEQIMFNPYREELGWPEVSPEEELKPVRRYGVVRFEGYCDDEPEDNTSYRVAQW